MIQNRSSSALALDLQSLFGPVSAEVASGIESWRRYWMIFAVSNPSGFESAMCRLGILVSQIASSGGQRQEWLAEHLSVSLRILNADTWLVELMVPDRSRGGTHVLGALFRQTCEVLASLAGATHVQGLPIELWLSQAASTNLGIAGATVTADSGEPSMWRAL